ncbi:MAG: PD-(D/E)XK nuclease family protein, partial [Actinomyces sp.]
MTRPGSGVQLEAVRPGPPALERLAELVDAAQSTDPLAPVTVVVPTNYAGLAVRRTLAAHRARAAVSFVTVNRLAEELAGPRLAEGGRRPVSTPLIAAAVRRVLDTEAGMFAPVAAHPSTERALVRAHRELAGLDETALDTLADASRRAREVVRLHRAVHALLEPRFTDEHDLLAAAIERAADPATDLTTTGEIVVYLPRRLAPAAGRLLATLGRRLGVTVLVGATGDPHADTLVGAVA